MLAAAIPGFMEMNTSEGKGAGAEVVVTVMRSLFRSRRFADVTFVLKDGQRVPAHRSVLAMRSHVFEAMLLPRWPQQEESASSLDVKITQTDPDVFVELLKFVYTDEVTLTAENIDCVWQAAQRYQINALQSHCSKWFKPGGELSPETACALLNRVTTRVQLPMERIFDYVRRNFKQCAASPSFLHMSEDLLIRIISSDELAVSEVDVFGAVVAWGRARCEDGVQSVQEAVKNVVRHVRIPRMTARQLSTVVKPSGVLTGEQLLDAYVCVGSQSPSRSKFFTFAPRAHEKNSQSQWNDSSGSAGRAFVRRQRHNRKNTTKKSSHKNR